MNTTKDKPPQMAYNHMRRSAFFQAGRPDNGNYLESGEIRGNMLTRRFEFPVYRTNGEKL